MDSMSSINTIPYLLGKNPNFLSTVRVAKLSAPTDASVLICGESGTGKENLKNVIHHNSLRKEGPLVNINCGGLPDGLLEAELFGYRKGAFTGAEKDREGKLKFADQGTLFLDEIGDMPLAMQAKMLRAIEEKKVTPLGENQPVTADFRVICATNKDLMKCVAEGTFREDFYYRINVIRIDFPPLRSRRNDIPLLAKHFINLFCKKNGIGLRKLSLEALESLVKHSWPGNIRELENVCEAAVVLSEGRTINPTDLPKYITDRGEPCTTLGGNRLKQIEKFFDEGFTLEDIKNAAIEIALTRYNSNKSRASTFLGLNRTTFARLVKKRGL